MHSKNTRQIRYEEIPHNSESFTLREFRWRRFAFNWHYHPEMELTLIEKGAGLRFVGDSVEEFASGDLCLIGANIPHCWVSHAKARGGVCSHVIQFLPDFIGKGLLHAPEMRALSRLMEGARRSLSFGGAVRRVACEKIASLAKHPAGSPRRLITFLDILVELSESQVVRPLAAVDSEPLSGERSGRKLARSLKFIHENLGLELTQCQVAEAIGVSPQAFSRFFKQAMGKRYIDYVNGLKIHKACRSLIETDASIAEVAFDAGFNNLSNFNEQFRHLKKITPREWRMHAVSARRGGLRLPPVLKVAPARGMPAGLAQCHRVGATPTLRLKMREK